MTTKHIIELTCDACKVKSDSAYSWARIHISSSTPAVSLGPDQHFDVCPDCWAKMRQVIYPPRVRSAGQP
jgi:hypothetical protein